MPIKIQFKNDDTIYEAFEQFMGDHTAYKFTTSYEVEKKPLFSKSKIVTVKEDFFITINRTKIDPEYPYYSDIRDSTGNVVQDEVYYRIINEGGKKISTKKITTKRIKVGNVNKIVYKGSRGGEYIKMNGKFINLKEIK